MNRKPHIARKYLKEQEKNICKDYPSVQSCKKLAKKYGTYAQTIYRILKRNNIILNKEGRRKFSYNENYFKNIDSEEKAYWLGFVAADGNICRNYFSLCLSEKDLVHLNKFKTEIEYAGKILKRIANLKGKSYTSYGITFSGKNFCNFLNNNGVTPKKSLTLKFPTDEQVPKKFISHFIRGYFDGDGSWMEWSGRCNFSIISSAFFIKELQKHTARIGIGTGSVRKTGKATELRFCGNNVSKIFYNFIYKDANIFLNRKKDKVSAILENHSLSTKFAKLIEFCD